MPIRNPEPTLRLLRLAPVYPDHPDQHRSRWSCFGSWRQVDFEVSGTDRALPGRSDYQAEQLNDVRWVAPSAPWKSLSLTVAENWLFTVVFTVMLSVSQTHPGEPEGLVPVPLTRTRGGARGQSVHLTHRPHRLGGRGFRDATNYRSAALPRQSNTAVVMARRLRPRRRWAVLGDDDQSYSDVRNSYRELGERKFGGPLITEP